MKLVVIESPYAGNVELNLRYLRAAMADSLAKNESPYASHGLLTQPGVLRDDVPDERARVIRAGFAWGAKADLVAVYEDLGVTPGMLAGIERAEKRGTPVERRRLPEWDQPFVTNPDPGCLKALALDAEGQRFAARLLWYGSAVEDINVARLLSEEGEDDGARFAAVGEAVAALANALRPLSKEQTRAIVAQFLAAVDPADLSDWSTEP